ncbi:hypothetical protein J3458_001946 [Metarhizium acridum]|uniref:uncharacterized protein n=1 Tax=Metarhizium acridum TaxID=92637 RepID=UPI001C6AF14B|nr:hypothetical protein J3458_001946 [Metarhizium acridum]
MSFCRLEITIFSLLEPHRVRVVLVALKEVGYKEGEAEMGQKKETDPGLTGQETKLHLEMQLALMHTDHRICQGMFVGMLIQRAFNGGGGLGRILSILHVADA